MNLEEMRLEALKLAVDETTANACTTYEPSLVVERARAYFEFMSGAPHASETLKPAKKRR